MSNDPFIVADMMTKKCGSFLGCKHKDKSEELEKKLHETLRQFKRYTESSSESVKEEIKAKLLGSAPSPESQS